MNNIGIIGLGLMGGSIAKTLRKSKKVSEIVAFDCNEETLKRAFDDKVIDGYSTNINEKFANSDIVFICTPVSFICDYITQLAKYIKNDCIITDIGSTKSTIVGTFENTESNLLFVGGHPMVGSEKIGYENSKDFLFENAYYIITKSLNTDQCALDKVNDIVLELKAIPIIIDASKHDFITAAISHVPHIIASALVNMVEVLDDKEEYMHRLAAGGFKDITRIASASPIMWENICMENKQEVLKVLDKFFEIIYDFRESLTINDNNEIVDFFSKAKEYRDSFKNINSVYNVAYDFMVEIEDKPGIIADVATILSSNNINIKNIEVVNNREHVEGILKILVENQEAKDISIEVLQNKGYNTF
ncbi:MAG TPA: prephenate dehydrogenase/arogenate dehydrogenase family protein [Clostridiales bacterium]|nr:MAG: hypothetical protein A2Y22_07970 [Clostridiales bacterium GWD2_32_59]HAN09130.1 prephenate dehydrogenase/arogenate dehydrogenase family protein [Clostridiales bacterium]